MNIIGLGKAGCAIAECFSKYPQYKTFYIDLDRRGENNYTIEKQQGPEQYEQNAPDLKKFLDSAEGACYIVIGGSGDISAMSLRVMEAIKDKKRISVVYIQPDRSLLSERKKKHERVTFNVLQQYARSGATGSPAGPAARREPCAPVARRSWARLSQLPRRFRGSDNRSRTRFRSR